MPHATPRRPFRFSSLPCVRVSVVSFLFLLSPAALADTIELSSPKDYQVFQRNRRDSGPMRLDGRLAGIDGRLEFKITGNPLEGDLPSAWRPAKLDGNHHFNVEFTVPAGGWYQVLVRVMDGDKAIAELTVPHVGVGEVFVVAGQSNSTNYGTPKQQPISGHVVAFDGRSWRIADDPQPGVQDHSKGGSFIPAFGDALYDRYKVPIGVAACGYGATSVRQWLPRGERIERHPTTDAFVRTIAPGQWVCTGQLYDGLMQRITALGPHGFRAILWHQGESDAGQARGGYPADRQITGEQYRQLLEKLIRATRRQAGWQIPWFVAQATYHSEKDPADEEFRAAQRGVCDDGYALPGPDTDALRADYRHGVHLNDKGLKAHGRLWAEKVSAYLDHL